MDQELKQRLIGAAVITALAAIFVPMLFDDPIDESGKSINELKIPELPAKAQDVEIMPLPEKVEDVATLAEEKKPDAPAVVYEGDEEADLEPSRPLAHIGAKDTALPSAPPVKFVEPDAEEEDVAIRPAPVAKPVKPAPVAPVAEAPVKAVKPVVVEPAAKPAAAAESAVTRLYLNAGSFSQLSNAQSLQDTLKKQGFAASIKEVVTEKGKIYKVRVGPMLDKAKAQAVKSKLSQINVNSFVTGDE
ncbi:SPOR domain-containing protein [Methylomonas methanica]|uniref:Sporulation domain-containing protein n=1 Tax=Methylomonas methanica (strain DSM 25384 / MC09) TaxID=857087 RepID=G0A406_METMM|nr:SPOR domain-containing protein [Methylomonas methanica]AEF99053.1 Sporulation domain-containing protein [Methylomonas methanica MC09]